MKIYACSDLHVKPDRFTAQAKAFLKEATREADCILLCGDIFEGSWNDLTETLNSPNGQELLGLIRDAKSAGRELILIRGNHDWTLQRYLDPEEFTVHTQVELKADGVKYLATHGWAEYDRPFGWLAPWYERILPRLNRAARLLQTWNILSPGRLKSQHREWLYWWRVRRVSTRSIVHAQGGDFVPLWGHTHQRHIDNYDPWLAINCGDFVGDNSGGVVIEGGVPRMWRAE